jgi:di/tricarboxylate transporter
MTWEGWLTVGLCCAVLLTLALTSIAADLVMLAALTVLLTFGVLSPADALSGFANEGAVTVGVLFVVAAGMRETGGMAWLAQIILGRPRSLTGAQARMMIPTAIMSAFMNNTPLVAMMLPVVTDWGKKLGIAPARLLMPLSFATILGGLCTLVGTSTNVVVHGLYARYQRENNIVPENGHYGLGFFDITLVGVCCAVVGIAYMLLTSRWLLVDRKPAVSLESDPREYTVEMMVEPGSPLVGRSIEAAGLRQLHGMFLMEIERGNQVIPVVAPEQPLEANDRLVFVGVVDSVVELQKIRGLRPATDQVFKLSAPRTKRCLIEAVVSNSCRLLGQSIREGNFRGVYNAVVIAVARNGQRIRRKVGDIVLEPGDTLLLEAQPSFAEAHRNSRDFYLVSRLEDSSPPKHEKAWVALLILGGMVIVAGMEWLSVLNAALIAAGLMVITRCITSNMARRAVDWQVLLVVGASLGIGRAMEITGVASLVAERFIATAGNNPWVCLAVIYGLTMIFTEVMSNNAAAALMFPIAMATSATLGVNAMPFIIVIMIAASCGFATPIGYQTNLMVYGPGGYLFRDFIRFGGLLNLIVGIVAVLVTPLVWPF